MIKPFLLPAVESTWGWRKEGEEKLNLQEIQKILDGYGEKLLQDRDQQASSLTGEFWEWMR